MALTRAVPGVETPGDSMGLGALSSGQRARWTLGSMAGRSSAMERLFLQIRYLAGHLRIATIEGERGTGKHLTAETLHSLGPAREASFVAGAADEFLRSTDKVERLSGLRGGTLYLAHVDALDADGQAKLLQLLEWVRGQSAPAQRTAPGASLAALAGLGAPRTLLVSSVRSLRTLSAYGRFRADLQQQLSLVQLNLPPLRDRREDLALLAEIFAAEAAQQSGKPVQGVAGEALPLLQAYHWPGNVTELEETIRCAVARADGPVSAQDLRLPCAGDSGRMGAHPRAAAAPHGLHITPAAMPKNSAPVAGLGAGPDNGRHRSGRGPAFVLQPAAYRELRTEAFADASMPHPSLDPNLDRAILRHIRAVLDKVHGNKLQAARLLGISRSTLYRLLDGGNGNMAASGISPQAGAAD